MINEMKKNVKGYKKVAMATQKIDLTSGRTQHETRVRMYYDDDKQTLYTKPGPNCVPICDWLNPVTEDEVLRTLHAWLWR